MLDNLPLNAENGDVFTTHKGIQYTFDGVKWRGTVPPPPEPTIVTGPQGVQGPPGEVGATGIAGQPGPAGSTGATGMAGATGIAGQPGPAGSIGATGVAGATGPQGPKGDGGEPGATGPAGISITSAVVTNGNLIITRSDGSTINAGPVSATAANTSTASAGVRMVGGAPNPFAPIIVSAPPGYKAANIDDGVELSLDTLAVQLAPSGARSLQFRVTTGTLTVNITGQIYWAKGDYSGNWEARYWNGNTLNTTWQQPFTWSFPWQGDVAIYNVQDVTNRRFYRITLSIGGGYKKNTIIIERMV